MWLFAKSLVWPSFFIEEDLQPFLPIHKFNKTKQKSESVDSFECKALCSILVIFCLISWILLKIMNAIPYSIDANEPGFHWMEWPYLVVISELFYLLFLGMLLCYFFLLHYLPLLALLDSYCLYYRFINQIWVYCIRTM